MNMPTFSGDAADIEPLQVICRTLLQHGAWFHRDLQVHAEQGELSLRSRNPEPVRMSYLRVPLRLMPVLDDFLITSDGRRLLCTAQHANVPQVQRTLMEAMLELYNLTEKLTHWESSYLGFWKDQDEVLQHLFSARQQSTCYAVHHNMKYGLDYEKTLADSFIGSRKFIMRADSFHASEAKRTQDSMVLLPLIDSLNHRSGVDGFKNFQTNSTSFMRIYAQPFGQNGELFISYNHYDPVDTLLVYGFVDESAEFFFSVPCTITVGTLKISIGNPRRLFSNPYRHPLLKSLGRDAVSMSPPLNQDMQISGIPIPSVEDFEKLRTLTDVIAEASGLVKSAQDMKFFRQGFIEKLLEYNLGWWQTMEEKTRHLDTGHSLRTLALKGLGHLNNVVKGVIS